MLTLTTGKTEWVRIYDYRQQELTREANDHWKNVFIGEGLLDETGEPVKNAVADMTLASGSGPKAPTLAIRVKLKMRAGEYILPILRQERVR